MITVIDYNMGNLRSIVNRFERLGEKVHIGSTVEDVKQADKLILPGVGSFAQGMKNLSALGIVEALTQKVMEEQTPILGICLGMQLFSRFSEEGNAKGLGWIEADTKKFQFEGDLKFRVPHVGWNTIVQQYDHPLLDGVLGDNRFYFTHSYHVVCDSIEDVLADTTYGINFTSVLCKENILGVQFHPETSHKDGIRLLENFVKL